VRPRREREEELLVWPDLVFVEFICATLFTISFTVVSALVNAPLINRANADITPNPSKAPWYFLNLQELLLHMDKGLAGVIVPTLWIGFMMTIPYIDRSREGVGIWFTTPTGKRLAIFSAIYGTVLTFGLIGLDFVLKKIGYVEFASQYLPGGKVLFPDYLIPIGTMVVLTALLVLLAKRIFNATTREVMIAVWTAWVCTYLVLTFVGTSMRGPGMDLYAPWNLPTTIE
ncbi:MAG: hypothetical protein H0W36_13640, partial [Gemmatimonadetes bacterium]|nr:hypothetical protein [Gemmatimonadota bacterium]